MTNSNIVQKQIDLVSDFLVCKGFTKDKKGYYSKTTTKGLRTTIRYRFLEEGIIRESYDYCRKRWIKTHKAIYGEVAITDEYRLDGFYGTCF